MSDGVRLRRAREADVAALARLERRSYETDVFDAATWRRLVVGGDGEAWVLVDDRGLLGMLALVPGPANLRVLNVTVAPRGRGHGFGHRLMRHAVRRARALGKLRVTLEVRVDNAVALHLYRSLGFRRRALLPGYYEDGADGYRMTLELVPARTA